MAQAIKKSWRYPTYPQKDVEKLARRMKSRWESFKDSNGMTQKELSESLGIAQPTLSQFFAGICPLSIEMLLRLCTKIECDYREMVRGIQFYENFFRNNLQGIRRAEVRFKLGSTSFSRQAGVTKMTNFTDPNGYLVEVATDKYQPLFKKGYFLHCVPDKVQFEISDILLIQFENQMIIGEYQGRNEQDFIKLKINEMENGSFNTYITIVEQYEYIHFVQGVTFGGT